MLVLDVVIVVALTLFAVAGVRRGPWPEVMTLGGLLLGALLADEWGEAWGNDLGGAVGLLGDTGGRVVVRGLLFLVPLLLIGYGGALILPAGGKIGPRARLAGALLGLFNGSAILAVLLRNWHYSQVNDNTALLDDAGTRFLLEWAGWWPLVLALAGTVVVAVAILRRPRRAAQTTPATATPNLSPDPIYTPPAYPPTQTVPAATGTTGAPSPFSGSHSPPPALPPARSLEKAPDYIYNRPPTTPAAPTVPTAVPKGSTASGQQCRTCNTVLAPGAAFCPNCGTPVG